MLLIVSVPTNKNNNKKFICPETQDTGPDTKGGYNLHLQLPVKTM